MIGLLKRIKWLLTADRIGPDMFLTHWMLQFPNLAQRVLQNRFAHPTDNVSIRPGSFLINLRGIALGKNVTVRPFSYIDAADSPADGPGVIVEDNVLLGAGLHIYISNHSFADPTVAIYYQGHDPARPVRIKSGAWIGANVVILPGVTIGENAVVGAGSIVTKDIPPRVVAAGVPARVIRPI